MTEPIDERRGHTSASNAGADRLCPGRHLAQRAVPEPPPTDDATFGHKIHAALAKGDPEGLTLDEAQTYDACQAIEMMVLAQVFGPDADNAQKHSSRHKRFWVRFKGNDDHVYEHSGELDVVHRWGTRGLVAEYKTLPGDVAESPRNEQLRDQAVLVRGELLLNEIAVVVIQPFVTSKPEVCVYTAPDLDRAASEMFLRVMHSNNPESPRIPGELQCKFCRAKPVCAEYQKWAGSTVPVPGPLLEVPVSAWTPEMRRVFCDQFDVAQKWLDTCWEAMVAGAAKDPAFVPGYGMKPGATFRTQQAHVLRTDRPQEMFERFTALGGDLPAFMRCVGIVNAQFKEEIARLTGQKGKLLEAAMKQLFEGLVSSHQNAASLKKLKEEK